MPASLPKANLIYLDPPWDVDQKGARGAQPKYPLMTRIQIAGLPISQLAADDAFIALWVTNGTLRLGYDLLEQWGFKPIAPITWVKFRLGLGNHLRHSTEHILLGRRGKAKVLHHSQPTWIQAPVREHSRKPEEVFALLERLVPGEVRMELFARRRPFSSSPWLIWGNEVPSDFELAGYPVPTYAPEAHRLP